MLLQIEPKKLYKLAWIELWEPSNITVMLSLCMEPCIMVLRLN